MYDFLIVGAGFSGATMARMLHDHGKKVLVIDRRDHIAGNAYDYVDGSGLLVHKYGPHIFHTNSDRVWAFLSRFTDWRPYEHRVRAWVDGKNVPFPINRTTLNVLYGMSLVTEDDAQGYLDSVRVHLPQGERPKNSKELVLSTVGEDLYEKFFRWYSTKQWGMDPVNLSVGVAARIPVRTNTDDRYFTDKYQAMPRAGYTRLFEEMLRGIDVRLSTGFDKLSSDEYRALVWTGPVDEYWGFRHGNLGYRSLKFKHQTFGVVDYQGCGTVNYPDRDTPFTRITEYKHLTGQQSNLTSIVQEYPSDKGEPYYPIPSPDNQALYNKYLDLCDGARDVAFVGRLAQYRYYNMDQAVAAAMQKAFEIIGPV